MRLGYLCASQKAFRRNSCFNEAEAHAPRILLPGGFRMRPYVASMRPRRMRLGYKPCKMTVKRMRQGLQ